MSSPRRGRDPAPLSVDEQRRRRLQQLPHPLDVGRRDRPIHHPVIERRRQVHHLPHLHRAVAHHRPRDDAVDADDRHLGVVDHRRRDDAAELAEAGDGERGAREFVARGLAGARLGGQFGDGHGAVPQVQRLRLAQHRHHQAAVGLRGHAQMHRVVQRQHAGLVVEAGVDLREVGHRAHDRADGQRQRREFAALHRVLAVQFLAQRHHLGDVDFLDVGEVRDRALGQQHLLRDRAAQADELDLARAVGRRCGGVAVALARAPVERAASRSACTMRPSGPLPFRRERSMPSARARSRTAGAASARGAVEGDAEGVGAAAAAAVVARGPASAVCVAAGGGGVGTSGDGGGAATGAEAGGTAAACGGGACAAAFSAASPPSSMRISTDPTAITCPTSPPSSTTRPATGEGTSTAALSVITSHSVWSSATLSPTLTRHSTISTSAMPSPMSGMRMTVHAHAHLPSPCDKASPTRCGPGK